MRCKTVGCAIPHDTPNHPNNYHGKSVTVLWKGQNITILRRPDQLLDCPCGEPLHRRYSRKILLRLCTGEGSAHPPPVCSDPEYLDHPFEQLPGLSIDEPDANHPLFADSPNYHGDEAGSSTSTGVDLPSGRLSPVEAVDDTLHPAMEVYLEETATRWDSSGDELKESEDEMEESCDEDGDIDMADGDDPVREDEDVYEDVETEAGAAALLLSCDFTVDPIYRAIICISCNQVIRYKNAYQHRTKFHSAHHKVSSRVIGKHRLESCLMQLRANEPQYPSPDSEGIPRLEHLAVELLFGCGVPGCSYKRICKTLRSFMRSHGTEQHRALSLVQRQPVHVRGHCFIRMKSESLYVRIQKVDGPSESTSDSPLALILQHSTDRGVGDPHKTLVISDKRELTEVLYHGEWVKILQEVSFEVLMAHAIMPWKDEPVLLRLRDAVRSYYQAIPPIFSQLGHLTRSQIMSHTLEYNNFQLFREPQNDLSLHQDADEMTRFLSFNLRCLLDPIENFPVHLHPLTQDKLESLFSELKQLDSLNPRIETLLHEAIWSFLSSPVPEYLKDDNACPLTRYLIAVHLKSFRGQFSKPRYVPPTLSKLQWSFRATACRQVLNIRSQYGDESNRAYVECVQPYLIAGRNTLFHSLKQSHAFYTTLSKNEPGYPRFGWDLEYKVLSMDGYPILMKDFAESLSGCLETLSMRINRLFRGCDYEDILEHISARLDPNNPKMWLQDDPLNSDYGESVITNPVNGFRAFGPNKEDLTIRLLNHLSTRKDLFTKKLRDDGTVELEAHKGNIMDWICELNECVKLLFYLHSNTINDRHVFVFNGMLTIISNYAKTQSIQGHGERVARCPSFAVSRLLLLLVTAAYPAALNIYPFVHSQSSKRTHGLDLYSSHLFVISGRQADPDTFTEYTREITSMYLGTPLGISSWRQFMHTMLINLAHVDFTSPDQQDEEVRHIHAMFAHTKKVGQQHYSVQYSNALADISATSVSCNQRTSFRWHAVNNILHPAHQAKAKSEPVEANNPNAPLVDHRSDIVSDVTRAVANQVLASIDRQTTELKRTMEESSERLMINSMQYTHARLSSNDNRSLPQRFNTVPIQVHPHLFEQIRSVLPSGSTYFQSPQQAELVQSTLGKENILAIMPTGSGKSLAFFSAPCLDSSAFFIVVTPLTALTEDMGRRLGQNHSINGGIYPEYSSQNGQLVFVAAHHAGTDAFLRWVDAQESRLRRVFIDECHHIYLSSTYRACFRLFHKLTRLKKPFTFLSSTVLPQSIGLLCRAMGIAQETLRIIRAPIARPNISYSVARIREEDNIIQTVTEFCTKFILNADDRGIIYSRTIADAKLLAEALGCDYYVSMVDEDKETNTKKKRAVMKRWQEGKEAANRWIVGTQCLGEGIDQSNVRVVVHANVTTLIDIIQQTGRAGRDWKHAFSFIFWNQLPWTSQRDGQKSILPDDWDDCYDVVVGLEHYGIDQLIIFLQAEHQCRRILLVEPHDGEAHSCSALGAPLCDNCQRLFDRIKVVDMCQDLNLEAPLAAAASSRTSTVIPLILRAQEVEGVLPRIEDVNTAGDRVRAHYQQSDEYGVKLQAAVNHLLSYGCVRCWVYRNPGESGHESHGPDVSTRALLQRLHLIQFDDRDVIHQAAKSSIDEEKCPFNAKIPRIIPQAVAFGFNYKKDGHFVYREAIANSLGVESWGTPQPFLMWLNTPVQGASRARNSHAFVIELHRLLTSGDSVE
ncbi:hypothetical protein F5146DRAFT_1130570 [Armillaria mellea]|nr:hypothetical protein F5146DRAFT_1130570 [Armillaria mellea]